MEAWSAVDAPLKIVRPMSPSKAFASKFSIEAPPALDISLKVVEPVVSSPEPGKPPLTIDMLPLAAVDALLKIIWPSLRVYKVCRTLLLLMTPVPLIISSPPERSGRRDV